MEFVSPERGWVVGGDRILATSDGGAHWVPATPGPAGGAGQPYLMTLQCAGPDSVWAQDLGTGRR